MLDDYSTQTNAAIKHFLGSDDVSNWVDKCLSRAIDHNVKIEVLASGTGVTLQGTIGEVPFELINRNPNSSIDTAMADIITQWHRREQIGQCIHVIETLMNQSNCLSRATLFRLALEDSDDFANRCFMALCDCYHTVTIEAPGPDCGYRVLAGRQSDFPGQDSEFIIQNDTTCLTKRDAIFSFLRQLSKDGYI